MWYNHYYSDGFQIRMHHIIQQDLEIFQQWVGYYNHEIALQSVNSFIMLNE